MIPHLGGRPGDGLLFAWTFASLAAAVVGLYVGSSERPRWAFPAGCVLLLAGAAGFGQALYWGWVG